MINLFRKDISLNRRVSFAFTLSGVVNFEGSIWFVIYSFYQLVNNLLLVTFAIVQVIVGSREIRHIVETLSSGLAGTLVLFKWFRLNLKRKEVRHIFNELEIIRLKMLQDEVNMQLVNKVETFGRKISIITIVFFNYGFPLMTLTFAIISDLMLDFKKNRLAVLIWVPWSVDTLWVHILTNCWLSLLSTTVLTILSSFFFIEIAFGLYVSTYLVSLQNTLMITGIGNGEILVQYKNLNQLISDYNEVMSGQMYIETLIAPLWPCGYGLAVIKALQRKDFRQSFHSIVRTFVALLPCIISCHFGQSILTQMERLHEASYMSNWYEEKPKVRKDLLMLMIRTTKPKSINYRLFATFDHVLLTAVLQVIYSYFTLMINLDQQ